MRFPPSAPGRAPAQVVLLTALGLLTAGCSQGEREFGGNRPNPSASKQQVVRTPSPVGTDLPQTDPPLVQNLPGASGGVPGSPQPVVPEASPGEDADGGGGKRN